MSNDPAFDVLRPGEGGFDSYDTKKDFLEGGVVILASVYQNNTADNEMPRLRAAAMTHARCCVCGKELRPLSPVDLDHHACYDLEHGNEIYHYCGEHCPACNGE